MRTKIVKKCPKCGDFLWLTEVGEYWDEYQCDAFNHTFKTVGMKNPYGPNKFELQEVKRA